MTLPQNVVENCGKYKIKIDSIYKSHVDLI